MMAFCARTARNSRANRSAAARVLGTVVRWLVTVIPSGSCVSESGGLLIATLRSLAGFGETAVGSGVLAFTRPSTRPWRPHPQLVPIFRFAARTLRGLGAYAPQPAVPAPSAFQPQCL